MVAKCQLGRPTHLNQGRRDHREEDVPGQPRGRRRIGLPDDEGDAEKEQLERDGVGDPSKEGDEAACAGLPDGSDPVRPVRSVRRKRRARPVQSSGCAGIGSKRKRQKHPRSPEEQRRHLAPPRVGAVRPDVGRQRFPRSGVREGPSRGEGRERHAYVVLPAP